MDQLEKEDYSMNESVSGRMACLSMRADSVGQWIETDEDCSQFCRCIEPEEFELVQINRYLADRGFYTISHGTVCLQDYFMEQIDSILKSYGYGSLNYGAYGIGVEPELDSQMIAEMIFETYAKEFEEEGFYMDEAAANVRVKEIVNR